MKKVLVFGIFDEPHETHRAMLQEAKMHGDYLIAVVAQDHVVQHLTGELPSKNFAERFDHLKTIDGVDKVVIGDADMATWNIVKRYRPDIVAFASDQAILKDDFSAGMNRLGYSPDVVMLKYAEINSGE